MYEKFLACLERGHVDLFPNDALFVLAARAALASSAPKRALDVFCECPPSMPMAVRKEVAKIAVEACDKTEDWKSAVQLYDSIAPDLDEPSNIAIYEIVVKIVARAGEFEGALDVNGGEWYRNNRTDKGWFPSS